MNIFQTSAISMANTNVCQWADDEVELLLTSLKIEAVEWELLRSSTLRVVLLHLHTQAQVPAAVVHMPKIAANDSLCIYTSDVEAPSKPST